MAKRILLDFDGTIHEYTTKFSHECIIADGAIIDKHGKSSIQFIRELIDSGFEVVIFSTRASHPMFATACAQWLYGQGLETDYLDVIGYTNLKTHHEVIYDDRAVNFEGLYHDIEFFKQFKPWNKREKE